MTETRDPKLDVTSDQFDPIKALYASADSIKPVKNARLYDNVAQYERNIQLQETDTSSANASAKAPANAERSAERPSTSTKSMNKVLSKTTIDGQEQFQRKFQAHQLMLPGTGPKARHKRNILDRLADDQRFAGPLAALQKQLVSGQRIKVYVRNASGVCGHMTGYLEMFDKHWNVSMRDVDEVLKRRKAFQCDTANFEMADNNTTTETSTDDCNRRMRELRLRFPVVTVKSLNRKYVECSRRLSRAMLRGEQVALIVLCSKPSERTNEQTETRSNKP